MKKFFIALFFCGPLWASDFWDMFVPQKDISTNGHLITDLFNYTTALNIFFFTLVCIGLFGFPFLYHYKKHPKPYFTYGNKKSHIFLVTLIGIAVFLAVDLNITRMSNNDMLSTFWKWPDPKEEKVLKVQVMAQQWAWNFRYPGPDDKFNTEDDIVLLNDLRVPANTKLMFQVTSKDVIHSFYIPNARLKVDAIPGRITRIWFDANDPGVYDIACAEMCGTHHFHMQAKLTVYSEENYIAWRDGARKIALVTNDIENPNLFWGWPWAATK